MFTSPADPQLDNFNIDYTPDLDYLDGADGFEFEDADLGGEMIGALPGSGPTDTHGGSQGSNGDGHEKRKSPDENDGAPEGDAKRQETEEGERAAKKPGRKPLTTEPTTVSLALDCNRNVGTIF
jgi:AP-1-like factor